MLHPKCLQDGPLKFFVNNVEKRFSGIRQDMNRLKASTCTESVQRNLQVFWLVSLSLHDVAKSVGVAKNQLAKPLFAGIRLRFSNELA